MKRVRWLLASYLVLSVLPAHAAVVGKEIDYRAGDTALEGFLAYDDARADQASWAEMQSFFNRIFKQGGPS